MIIVGGLTIRWLYSSPRLTQAKSQPRVRGAGHPLSSVTVRRALPDVTVVCLSLRGNPNFALTRRPARRAGMNDVRTLVDVLDGFVSSPKATTALREFMV